MRILVDAHALGSRKTGNETYIRGLMTGLDAVDYENEYHFLLASADLLEHWRERFPRFTFHLVPSNPIMRLLYGIPKVLERTKADVLHVQYTLPPLCRTPAVVTVHDISYEHFPAFFTPGDALRARLTIPPSARRARRVITISNYSKADLADTYRLAPDKIVLTPLGVEAMFVPMGKLQDLEAVLAPYEIRGPYVLAVGNLQPRKNLPALFKAFDALLEQSPELPHRLVIVGQRAWSENATLRAAACMRQVGRVVFTGYVPDADLPALYSGADCFVYPSLFEGFGLPPLEAMACGTAVIAGKNSAIPEVVGGAGLLVDVSSPEEIARALATVLGDRALKESLEAAGLLRARAFTWERCARETLVTYQAAASEAGRREP